MSRENFISRRARGLETVVKVVDVPSLFSTTEGKTEGRGRRRGGNFGNSLHERQTDFFFY